MRSKGYLKEYNEGNLETDLQEQQLQVEPVYVERNKQGIAFINPYL